MSVVYWVAAGLLAVFYLYAGGLKLLRPRMQLEPMMRWVRNAPMAGVRVLGAVEILGALGLVLPPLSGIAPALALAAAVGLLVLQVLATVFHLSRGDTKDLWLNATLLALAVVAAFTLPIATSSSHGSLN